ncbi:17078_t:CDS:1, partial [Dentiscutata heterogama]
CIIRVQSGTIFHQQSTIILPHNLSISNNFETLDPSRLVEVSHDKIPTQRKITFPENKNDDLFDITTDIFCEIDSALSYRQHTNSFDV